MVTAIFFLAHWLIVIGLSLRVIMRRRPVGVSLAWLAVLMSIPFLGALIYLLFGEQRLGLTRSKRMSALLPQAEQWLQRLQEENHVTHDPESAHTPAMAVQAQRVLGVPVTYGNSFQLLHDFQSVFDTLVRDIDAATTACDLEFYIWHVGGRVEDVIAALLRAAGRGVDCRVMADGIGSKHFLRESSARKLRAAGIQVIAALPTNLTAPIFVRADIRNHRKIAVIDNRVAYTGSQNLVDPRFFKQGAGVGEWVDAMVRVEGPAVQVMSAIFASDWAVETASGYQVHNPTKDAEVDGKHPAAIQVIPSGPGPRPELIHQLLLTAIYSAQKELVMTTPYFVPDESLMTALLSAALRGVHVTIILPARNDSVLVRFASESCYEQLLQAGARIAGFQGGLLHTKSIAVDDNFSVFGSVNLDMRSFWLNFEVSLFVYDQQFTAQLRQLQNSYLEDSQFFSLADWERRPFRQRLAENTVRLLSPLL